MSTNFTTRAKHFAKVCFRSLLNYFGGWSRNRTGVHGVAVRCMTTLPSSHSSDAILPKIFKITSKIFKNFQKCAKSMSLLIKKHQLQDTNLTTYPKYLKNLTVLALKSAIIRNLVILYLSLNVRKILAKIGWFLRVCLILCLREFCGYGSYGYQYQVSRSIKLFIQC